MDWRRRCCLLKMREKNITLIFDGAEMPHALATRPYFDTIEFIYTPKGLSADDFIASDSDLARQCRLRRAQIVKAENFLILIEKTGRKKKPREHLALKALVKLFEERIKNR
jgi:hypothetical protein